MMIIVSRCTVSLYEDFLLNSEKSLNTLTLDCVSKKDLVHINEWLFVQKSNLVSKLKSISFRHCFLPKILNTKLLQMFIPLSDKDFTYQLEIEKLEKQHEETNDDTINSLKQNIIEKYATKDIDELTYYPKGTLWTSDLEMIELQRCVTDDCSFLDIMYMKRKLTTKRIINNLFNLKSLAFVSGAKNYKVTSFIIGIILNNLACQLISLHIMDDVNFDNDFGWKFLDQTIHKSAESLQNITHKKWFPVNVQELCLSNTFDRIVESHFWSNYLHSKSFIKLQHLRIHNTLDEDNMLLFENIDNSTREIVIKNMLSLLQNGLVSLEFKIENIPYDAFGFTRFEYFHNEYSTHPYRIINFWIEVFNMLQKPIMNNHYTFLFNLVIVIKQLDSYNLIHTEDENQVFQRTCNELIDSINKLCDVLIYSFEHNIVFRLNLRFEDLPEEYHQISRTLFKNGLHNLYNHKLVKYCTDLYIYDKTSICIEHEMIKHTKQVLMSKAPWQFKCQCCESEDYKKFFIFRNHLV